MNNWIKQIKKINDKYYYEGGISMEEAAKLSGRSTNDVIPLQSNENLFIEKGYIKDLLMRAIERIDPRFYPKNESSILRDAIGKYLGLSPDTIFLGNGTDQVIDLLTKAFKGKTGIGIVEPTFSMYGIRARLNGSHVNRFNYREDFSLPLEEIISQDPGLLFLCSPNNPTGHLIKEGELRNLADSLSGLIVIDETYAELSGSSLIKYVKSYENVAIMRTFSKAFGLAGFRVGYISGPLELIKALNGIQLTFPITNVSLVTALEALEHIDYFRARWNEALETMQWFVRKLNTTIKRTPTKTFFLTISTDYPSDLLFSFLLGHGFITRKLQPFFAYENPLRFSMAPRQLIDELPDLINKYSGL